jgi:hypothetical protein
MDDPWVEWSDTVNRRLAAVEKRHKALVDALPKALVDIIDDRLQKQRALRDRGTWQPERLYGPGAAVTDKGAMWVAQIENKATRPGDNACWRLAVKSDTAQLRRIVADELNRRMNGDAK